MEKAFNFTLFSKSTTSADLLCYRQEDDWGNVDEARVFEILSTAVDAGVNFFDTADEIEVRLQFTLKRFAGHTPMGDVNRFYKFSGVVKSRIVHPMRR